MSQELAENIFRGLFDVLIKRQEIDIGVKTIVGQIDVGGVDINRAAVANRFIAVNRENLGRALIFYIGLIPAQRA